MTIEQHGSAPSRGEDDRNYLLAAHSLSIGSLEAAVQENRVRLRRRGFPAALWERHPEGWTSDAATQALIAKRLGWITAPREMVHEVPRLEAFAAAARHDGFTDVVLLGMGGSSLAAEVLRTIVGIRAGWPVFHMLDSTDPAAIRQVDGQISLNHTLFILASKSGTTIEPNAVAAYFQERLRESTSHWGDQFIAITDPETVLHRRAIQERFRDVFLNPADIGGRYSVLSFFGLVPAVLMGIDIRELLRWAVAMLDVCRSDNDLAEDPASALGTAIGTAALAGRDKLTLMCPPSLDTFGIWVEQLIAESTGKKGTGIVPVVAESPAPATTYSTDRFFVFLLDNRDDTQAALAEALQRRGDPVALMQLAKPEAIGAEFVRWEIATALAGAVLEINPFDEPNVQQAKDATKRLLTQYERDGTLSEPAGDQTIDSATLTMSRAARSRVGSQAEQFFSLIGARDYFAILAFLPPLPWVDETLKRLREAVRDRRTVATMLGYGPRYLHSTGQLHKGGPSTGVFLMITADPTEDMSIPDQPWSFGVLERAQALGDFAALDDAQRRVLRVHLPRCDVQDLTALCDTLARWQA